MKVYAGMEVRYSGSRAQVLSVREGHHQVKVDIVYLSGAWVGRELTVDEFDLEPLEAYARPTLRRSSPATSPAGTRA